MKRILFQGDSITDAGRSREEDSNLGLGYSGKVASKLGLEYPGKYEFLNRGISGNRIVDLYARIKSDIINLAPDYMSIMIGVNDVWHELSRKDGVDAEKYERIYDMLLQEVKVALPNIRIMLLEPYVLEGNATTELMQDGSGMYEVFRREVEKRAEGTKRLAEKHGFVFVPLQEKLDALSKVQPSSYWMRDGVHPTNVGHEFIACEWIKFFGEKLARM